MPLVLGGSSAVTPAYDVDNSCRIDHGSGGGATSYMTKSSTSVANRTKGTISVWLKRTDNVTYNESGFDNDMQIIGQTSSGHCRFMFTKGGEFKLDGPTRFTLLTDAILRDFSAWYHLFVTWDTTGVVQADRTKMYINGTRITSFSTATYPDQDDTIDFFVDGQNIVLGATETSGGYDYLNAMVSEVVALEGTAAAVTDFGEFDSASPTIWKPIEHDQSGNKGANGFYLDFKDSANLGNDAYGGTDFTETQIDATDQATDSPTNSFATLNSIATTSGLGANLTFSEGNCKMVNTGGGLWEPAIATIAAKAGKWYAEFKVTAIGGAHSYGIMDPVQYNDTIPLDNPAVISRAYGYSYSDGNATNNSNSAAWGVLYTTGDIISVAMDLDNMKLYCAKNGTWADSGDPTSGATGTGTHDYFGGASNSANAAGVDWYTFMANIHNSSTNESNFGGCPAFTITAESGAGFQDGNEYGKFEYAVPSGYYALCTKNLAEFGG